MPADLNDPARGELSTACAEHAADEIDSRYRDFVTAFETAK